MGNYPCHRDIHYSMCFAAWSMQFGTLAEQGVPRAPGLGFLTIAVPSSDRPMNTKDKSQVVWLFTHLRCSALITQEMAQEKLG